MNITFCILIGKEQNNFNYALWTVKLKSKFGGDTFFSASRGAHILFIAFGPDYYILL